MDTNWAAELSSQHRAEREAWARAEAEHLAARAKLAEEVGRLRAELERAQADNAALRAGAIKAGRELRELKIELRNALYGEVA